MKTAISLISLAAILTYCEPDAVSFGNKQAINETVTHVVRSCEREKDVAREQVVEFLASQRVMFDTAYRGRQPIQAPINYERTFYKDGESINGNDLRATLAEYDFCPPNP